MYAVEVSEQIMIAHSFRGQIFGPAQKLHGATFVVRVAFLAETLDRHGIVVDIARAHDATVTQVALAWLLHLSPVMLPIPGTSKVAHLESNTAAAGIELSDDEVKTLSGLGG